MKEKTIKLKIRKKRTKQDSIRLRRRIVLISLFLSLFCLAGVIFAFNYISNKTVDTSASVNIDASVPDNNAVALDNGDSSTTQTTQNNTTLNELSQKQAVSVDIMMIGDMLVHEGVYKSGLMADGSYNFDHLFKNISDDIKNPDISIVNQETILGGTKLGLSGYPCFNSPYELGDAEVSAGFDIILHATNHSLDKGTTGINNCVNFWKTNYPDQAVLGLFNNEEDASKIYVYEKDGFKIAFLNYTYGTNGIPIPSSMPYCVNILEEEKVTSDVKKAKELADMVIVCPHWGTEYIYKPDSNQQYWSNLFLSLGVDVVIGSHPHVLEPVEVLTGDDGHKMLVYYSLGNFVSNQDQMPRMIGGMANVTLVKEPDGSCYIKSYSLTPIVTQKEFGTAKITSYKLIDYNDTLAADNAIRKDSGCSSFSYTYCKSLCSQILGEAFDSTTCTLKVDLK